MLITVTCQLCFSPPQNNYPIESMSIPINFCVFLHQAGDLIMADKGFLIHDVMPQGTFLNLPAFLSGKAKFTKEEAVFSRNISRARIHVERAIQRLRNYTIIQTLTTNQSEAKGKCHCSSLCCSCQSPVTYNSWYFRQTE